MEACDEEDMIQFQIYVNSLLIGSDNRARTCGMYAATLSFRKRPYILLSEPCSALDETRPKGADARVRSTSSAEVSVLQCVSSKRAGLVSLSSSDSAISIPARSLKAAQGHRMSLAL